MRSLLPNTALSYREIDADDAIGLNVEKAYEFWLA
jgi:hypothetical protein